MIPIADFLIPVLAIPFPEIDPVIIEIGPLAIRWYSLAYVVGLLLGWRYCYWLAAQPPVEISRQALDDFLVWAMIGIVLGGRFGYVFFYKPGYYLDHPIEILYVWQGGMSFHGGLLGIIAAMVLFARRRGLLLWHLTDLVAAAGPIGLFLGRLANFINGELWGRVSDVPWAMAFPTGGAEPRHPSQLYEAALEGLLLFLVLFALVRLGALRRPGFIGGVFIGGYGLARAFVEQFREPDEHIGFLWEAITMGQLLSFPMILAGAVLVILAFLRAPVPQAARQSSK